ncbi:MAG: hypothetical protein ACFFB3_01220 [Candidatus Hodarchaeota archaeon]
MSADDKASEKFREIYEAYEIILRSMGVSVDSR